MIILTDAQKRTLFNGRVLNGDFRRGFWKKDEFDGFTGKKPQLPMTDYKAFLWYNGAVAFYIKDGFVVCNTRLKENDEIIGLMAVIKQLNNITTPTDYQDLGGKIVNRSSTMIDRLMI